MSWYVALLIGLLAGYWVGGARRTYRDFMRGYRYHEWEQEQLPHVQAQREVSKWQ